MAASSLSEALSPFIFQFLRSRGRRFSVMIDLAQQISLFAAYQRAPPTPVPQESFRIADC